MYFVLKYFVIFFFRVHYCFTFSLFSFLSISALFSQPAQMQGKFSPTTRGKPASIQPPPEPSVLIPLMPGTPWPALDHGSSERLSHTKTQVPLTEFISCLCWHGFIFVGVFPKESQNSTVKQEVRELAEQWLMRTVCASNCLPCRSGICLREKGQAWCCPSWP